MDAMETQKLSDRELLILLHERQGVMGVDIKELKDGTNKEVAALTSDVNHLKESKADKAAVDQLTRGQQRLFNYLWFAFGALAVLQIALSVYLRLRQ